MIISEYAVIKSILEESGTRRYEWIGDGHIVAIDPHFLESERLESFPWKLKFLGENPINGLYYYERCQD